MKNTSENIQNLLKRAEELKNETEKLIQEAKDLSHEGVAEVEELVNSLKSSFQNLVHFGTSFFKTTKRKAAKKKPTKKKAVKKKAVKKKTKR